MVPAFGKTDLQSRFAPAARLAAGTMIMAAPRRPPGGALPPERLAMIEIISTVDYWDKMRQDAETIRDLKRALLEIKETLELSQSTFHAENLIEDALQIASEALAA